MRAIVQTGRKSVEVREVERPSLGPNDVLIDVEHAGVCGSDVHAYLQMDGFEWIQIPRIMGHEYAGHVVETGENVTRFQPGDAAVEAPIHPCGECHQCEVGEVNVCQNTTISGMHTDGAYAEYTSVHEDHLVKVPEGIPTKHAALTEPLSIAARSVYERSTVTPGDSVVVQGPGPIGVLTAALLDSMGTDVVLSGIGKDTEYRLPLVERLGIDTVNAQDDSLSEHVDARTDGIGVEAVFDTTGHKTGIESSVDLVKKGGEIVVIGLPGDPSELFFSPIVRAELDIRAAYGATKANFKQALRMLEMENIDADTIIDTRYTSDEPAAVFEDFLAGRTCKPMFSF
ncbi:alcohol dehydrogenase [Salinigranum rubrum]|uniref:Alcohol dehydrogenase n=1 Tax=Salinigranum rubrum TaxID=755307 RepID=A0A2I8VNS8_9EURY|nr:alcohol dehydrogenase catalytic domain-containing protein [Salinigranum rubrum]AUV83581.1 alcohol dehydrogenase [Salinigranum rubrum]